MRLRDLFRRHPDAPVPTPARHPDWPTMPPVQRVVGSPDLITAPDRFPDDLVSWRNPSQGGTLGHYVTPDAPAGVSAGLATAAPRGDLPAPARPWWWPRPPTVQRHVSTSTPETVQVGSDDPAPTPPPAVPVHPPAGHALVSAAGAEPPAPRLVRPAVQRHAAEPETGQEPVTDPDLSGGESPPEVPLPPVVAAQTEPLPDADSWPGNRPDLPTARRLGLGAPLQRVPDAGGGPWADSAPVQHQPVQHQPVQRHIEAGAEPMDVAPLVSDSPSMVPAVIPPEAVPSIGPAAGSRSTRAVDTSPRPGSTPVRSPSTESTSATPLPATTAPAGAGPSTVQRHIEVDTEPMDVAPLISDSPPMASAAVPSTEPAAESGSSAPSLSTGSPPRSTMPGLAVQRAVDTPPEPEPDPVDAVESPPAEPATVTPLPTAAAPTGAEPSTVHRQIEVEPMEVAPLVSDSPSMASMASVVVPSAVTPSTEPAAGSRSTSLSPSPQSVQRATGSDPVRSPSVEPIAPAPAGAGPSMVQRRIEAEPMEVAPLVSDTPPMASVAGSPMASVAGSPMPSGPVVTPSPASPLVATSSEGPAAGPSLSTGSPSRSTMPGLAVQRAVGTPPAVTPFADAEAGSRAAGPSPSAGSSARSNESSLAVQRAVVGLVSDRPIEPVVTGYAAVDSAGGPVAVPAVEQTRWPAVQRHGTIAGQVAQVATPRAPATTVVQRSIQPGAGPAASWPPGALAVGRSSPGVGRQASPLQLAQFVQLTTTAPAAAESNPPALSTGLVVQRADDEPAAATDPAAATGPPTATDPAATDPAAATGSAAATGAAAGAPPASAAGPTSPTEIDTLVRRLYDPIVRRLKAELQRDRERAGRSLDLWH